MATKIKPNEKAIENVVFRVDGIEKKDLSGISPAVARVEMECRSTKFDSNIKLPLVRIGSTGAWKIDGTITKDTLSAISDAEELNLVKKARVNIGIENGPIAEIGTMTSFNAPGMEVSRIKSDWKHWKIEAGTRNNAEKLKGKLPGCITEIEFYEKEGAKLKTIPASST